MSPRAPGGMLGPFGQSYGQVGLLGRVPTQGRSQRATSMPQQVQQTQQAQQKQQHYPPHDPGEFWLWTRGSGPQGEREALEAYRQAYRSGDLQWLLSHLKDN
jgi:hypothetical protein